MPQSAREARVHNIDLVVDRIVRIPVLHADRQKLHSGQHRIVFSKTKLNRRQLLRDETIVWKVRVERADHVIPIGVRERKLRKSDRTSATRVCVPGNVEPMPAPSLNVSR